MCHRPKADVVSFESAKLEATRLRQAEFKQFELTSQRQAAFVPVIERLDAEGHSAELIARTLRFIADVLEAETASEPEPGRLPGNQRENDVIVVNYDHQLGWAAPAKPDRIKFAA